MLGVPGGHADRKADFNITVQIDRHAVGVQVTPLDGLKDRLGDAVEIRSVVGCGITPQKTDEAEIAKAVDAARGADVAIVCVGTNLKVEAEAHDRTSLMLPGAQEKLIEAVYAANPKTVVVLMNAGPLSTKWARDNVPAMLEAWYAGEEGGNAIADVLLGNVNPGGKLPYTVYESPDQIPPIDDYDITHGYTYRRSNDVPEYMQIVKALIANDPDRAADAMGCHIRSITRVLIEIVFPDSRNKRTPFPSG